MSDSSIFRTSLIDQVQEGMTVIDADGEKLGTVEYIKAGDAGAATTGGNELGARDGAGLDLDSGDTRPGGVFVAGGGTTGTGGGFGVLPGGAFAPVNTPSDERVEDRLNVFDDPEPDVPEPLRSRLLQAGFIKIDGYGPGFLDTDRYVRADQIADVGKDTVRLNVRRGEIPEEGMR
jgi:hypothetical protein